MGTSDSAETVRVELGGSHQVRLEAPCGGMALAGEGEQLGRGRLTISIWALVPVFLEGRGAACAHKLTSACMGWGKEETELMLFVLFGQETRSCSSFRYF